jgi:hypothetical protein
MSQRGIDRLEQRTTELGALNVATVPEGNSPALTALSRAIRDTLDGRFGEGTPTFGRFVGATELQFRPMMMTDSYPQRHHYQEGARTKIEQSVALLRKRNEH